MIAMAPFRRSGNRYARTEAPVTPYQKAAQLWDERIGSARVQARNWRLMSFALLGLLGGVMADDVYRRSRSTVTPFVVEVDKLGAAQAVAPAVPAGRPSDQQIAYYLARFITDVRSISIDPVIVRQNWLEAYDYATDHAAATLNAFARANDPFAKIGERSAAVDISSVIRASDTSFQVKWVERVYDHGTLSATEHWTAILSIVLQTPHTEEKLRKNPLGIYVNGLNWSRELG
jgi:type IV secretory pathway TrbF-like protein